MRRLLTFFLLLAWIVAPLPAQTPGDQTHDDSGATPAGSTLRTIFSPSRAPKRKTMGLLQRSFLDLADQGDQELEIAVVVDGTKSMAAELAGVRQSIHQMLDDLRRVRDNDVRVAIVIYRDHGGKGTDEVVIPQREFTDDKDLISKAVEKLQPESGAPYFHELPDLGLQHAMDKLPWSDNNQVAKWILLFGDAPPYPETPPEGTVPEARRRVATSKLISSARSKNIRINCILCTSSDDKVEPYNDVIEETRDFMEKVSLGTDGLMLDLSYDKIKAAMIDADKQPEFGLVEIAPITAIDLASVLRPKRADNGQIKQVSLAVIPHLPISKMSFDARLPAVRVSTALRTKLAQIPGVRVASPRDVKEKLRRLDTDGIREDRAMKALAGYLGVDFVVWGSLMPDASVQTAAYRRDDGQAVVPIKLAKHSDDMAFAMIEASARSGGGDDALAMLVSNMGQVSEQMKQPLAKSRATSDDLLTALEALEQALAFEAGDEESVGLLETADRASKDAIQAEDENAMAHWLQANVAYNQAARLYLSGDAEAGLNRMQDVKSAMTEAIRFRENVPNKALVTEIEADYYVNDHKYDKAVERYQQLIEPNQPSSSQLRGHWMLAGIFAGDWGAAETDVVDPVQARRHVIEVMANWPDSPEAKLLKQWLRWDETKDETNFNYLPQMNTGLAS